MNVFDASALPDPATVPRASRRAQKQARRILGGVPDYFDIAPSDRASAQMKICQAIQIDPHNPHGWFDLGIHLKLTRQWESSALCNLRATQLGDLPEGSPEFWNLAIACTALHDWADAREAWIKYGLPLTPGPDEVAEDYGPCPVRIFGADGSPEVVWGSRIGPARIQVHSVPLPQSGHRWNDIILHDGAPNGYRTWYGNEYPVFDELERWAASNVTTLECLVQGLDADVAELLEMFPPKMGGAEDWTTGIQMLCQECSEGRPSESHKHGNFLASENGRTIGIAADLALAEQILDQWVSRSDSRSRSDILNAESAGL